MSAHLIFILISYKQLTGDYNVVNQPHNVKQKKKLVESCKIEADNALGNEHELERFHRVELNP